MKATYLDRFLAKVEPQPDGCLRWVGTMHAAGYGVFWMHSRRVLAHRAAYEMCIGSVPEGTELDHLCRNRWCVNPTHLEPVTHQENILRGEAPAARFARRSTCKYGHPLTPDNCDPRAKERRCRICEQRRAREHYLRHADRIKARVREYARRKAA